MVKLDGWCKDTELRKRKISSQKAERLKVAASSFEITLAKSSFSFQLKTLIEQISFIENQMKETEAEISGIIEKLESLVATITGIESVRSPKILI